MVDDITNRIHTASIHTRIAAFLIEAAAIGRAVVICNTLGIRTNGRPIDDTAEAIYVARIGRTWIFLFPSDWSTFNKWIAGRLAGARTDRAVVHCLTDGSKATHIRTRVNAFIVHACL